ncbi:uncharacterized protein LOC122249530 isoform X3 [Penaeus japonicus]|uniref:uncharacterized protein LOC122249530 isoform X3 n=1 Tax=Penaeus japonicus TaxID=27405 RepID=UPI001C70DCDC|nr:uncharacterized protein LOC122249530 isoform X3 [Penaeus japonicus]
MILELAIVILVTSSLPRHRRDNALQVKTSDEGERVSCNSCQMLLSHPMTCPQRKARPGSTSQAPRTYNSDLFQLFWKLPSMTLPSRLLPFALPSLSGSLSSLFSKIKSFRRVPKTEGGSSLLPPFCCASPKDTRSLAPSPAPPLDTTPCCSCASCRPCCSCCFCRDPKVQRTSDARWFTWLLSSSVASTAEGGVASGSTGGGGGGSGHAKSCGRCGGGFSIFFNKRVRCGGCDLAVCRKCAPWSAADKAYVCGVCSQPPPPKEAEPQSPDTQADAAQLKEVEESVRAHIEALTEGQVGGPLDHVNAVPNLAHSKAIPVDFSQVSERNKWDLLLYYYCYCHDRPLPPEDLPTSRHAHLSERIKTVKEAMILPIQNEAYDPAASPETPVEDFNSHTYEDILATAILNKVLESCEGERPDEVTIEVSHEVTSTDTDSGMSGGAKESRRGRHKRGELSEGGSEGSEERSLTPPRRSSRRPPTVSPDQGVVTDDSWAQAAAGDGPPLQFKIEEHVEEITTHHLTDDDHDLDDLDDEEVSDSGGSWRGSRCSLDDSRERRRREKVTRTAAVAEDALLPSLNIPLPDPSHQASRRVSFPELGADIVHDSCSDTDCCQVEPGDMVMDNDTWEENWLFRRQRLVPGGGAGGAAAIHDPVTMLIPNPEAHVLPTVGNRDVDELSELSEQHSLGSGEPWSTSESEGEGEGEDSFLHQQASRELSALAGEIVAEFGQKDQEYTVDYSVPSRVSRSSGALTSPPHATSHRFPLRAPGDSPTRASHPQYVDRDCREGTRSFGQGRGEDALRSPERYDTPRSDSDGRCDTERPVPKPRKLSLATPSPAKTSAKSPTQYLPSPSEDLSILSPPLEVPNPKAAPTSSPAVWFVAGPEDCTVTQGRTLRLVCQVNTKRPMGLSWYHNGSLIPSGGRDHWLWRQGSYHHLHVFATTPDTAGVYAAAAYTANTCVWAFCRVLHKSSSRPQKRPSFTKGLSDVIAEEGSEVTLQCQVTGHPEPRVTFSRGSERLASSSRVFIESDQYGTWTVKLSECSPHDSGEIVASASNHMGTTTTRCHVRIVPEGTPIPREETDNRRAISSPSKHDHPSAPGRRHDHRTHGSHKAKSSGQAATTNHSALASANTSPHRVLQDPLTTFSGVPTDADDLDEILQVPTKPGRRPKTRGSACPSAVDTPHVSEADSPSATRARREALRRASAWLDSDEEGRDEEGDFERGMHGRSVNLGPPGSSRVIVQGEGGCGGEGDGDGAEETGFLSKGQSASQEPSSPLCQEARNSAFTGLESSLVSPQGALTLDLDYCPSSHDDASSSSSSSPSSSSDEDDQPPPRKPSTLSPSLSPLPKAQTNPPTSSLGSSAPSIPSAPPHASGAPTQHLKEHEDASWAGHEAEAIATSTPQPGTIAEREHRKWEAAVPLANNPYAPERLVQRLSHSRSSSTTHIPRALRVDFPEDSPKDLDPSLRDGVPPQADLKRYSRDYYVATSANNSGWQRSPQAHHVSQQPRAVQAQLANGHHLPTSRSTSDLVSSQVHIRLVTGVSESAGELKKASPEGATEDLLHREEEEEEEEEDSSQSQEGGAIRPSKRGDWKDELRDIQSARVEREVARFQRTIDETQRRWEENYGRVAPRSVPATGHSDSSTEGLHNPRPAAYLVPPRHDLWRTVSVDTLGGPARDRPALQPLLRHTSVDNLRPSTKVSNLSPLGPNPRQSSMNTVSSLSNINLSNNNCGGNKTTTATAMTTYQSQPAHGQSVESMSGYSDGESHGDGNDSDVSTSTPDKVPMLPSVRKLASKFDVASRERVNDLDKHGKDGSLAFNGKKNIFIEKSSPTDQPYIRNLTNNLNKRTEKTYNVKEVRSLPNSSNITHETQPASDTDTYFTDHDDSEFDDQATVTSVSLPPTPHSLNGRLSYSTSSLLDSDSCYSLDDRDQSQISPGEEASKTIFGVTLRKVSPWSGNSRPTSSSSSRTNDETAWHNTHYDRQNSYSSSVDSYHERIPISETDSDSDAPNALRQVTIIKIDDKPRPEHQSMTDLSVRHSKDFSKNRRYSSTFSLSSENEFAGSVQPVRKTSLHALPPLQPLNVNSRQKSMPNLGAMPSIAFAPKGRKRSMRDFLKSYQRQTSLSEINRIEEKVEEEWGSQRNGHVPLQRMTSVPSWHRSSFHEEQKISPTRDLRPMQEAAPKHEPSPVQETDQTKSTKENAIESPTVTYKNTLSSEKVFPSSKEEIDTSSNSKTGELRETKNSQKVENFQHESDDESSMSDSTITSEVQEHTGTEPVESDDNETPMNRAKSVSDLLKLYTELETKAGRPPSRTTKKEIFGSQDLLDKEPNRQNYERETFSRSVSRNNEKQNDFLDHGKAEADKNEREYLYSQEQVPRELTQETSPGEPFSPNDERVKNSLGYLEIESSIPKKEAQEPVQVEPNQVPSNKEPPSPAVVLDDDKVKDFLGHIAVESDVSTPDSAKELEEPNIDAEKTGQDGHKKPLVKAKSISDLLKLYSDKRTIGDEIPSKLPTKDSAGNSNKTIITLSDNEHYPKAHQNSAKIIPSDEPVSVHRSRGTESVPPKKAADFGKAISYDQPDSRTSRPQQDLPRSERANPQKTRTPTSGSVPSKRPVFTQNAKPFGKLSKSEEKAQVTNTDRNGNSVYEGHDNRTVINVSDNSSDSVYFASYINIDSEDSGYSPTKYPSYSDVHQYSPSENNNTNREYSSEDFSFGAKEQNTTASSANQELVSTSNPWVKYSQIIPIDMDSHSSQNTPKVMTEDTNHNSVQVIEKEAKGPHVTVISLSEGPPSVPPPAPPSSDETSEDDAYCDPLSLTRMIVHGSRCGSSSNRKLEQRKKMIESATVPRNSPFSPLKRKQPFFPDPTVTTSPPHADASLHKMKLRPQNSYDEGVDLTLSDAELAQSAVSSEAKSTSSVDTVGKDSPEPRVLSD